MMWKPIKGALTAPVGMRWWNNGESRFSGNYRHELRPEPQSIDKRAIKAWMPLPKPWKGADDEL